MDIIKLKKEFMTDKTFTEEVRARTGEPDYIIRKTINYINGQLPNYCYGIDYVYDEVIKMLDDRVCWDSMGAAKLLFV